MPSGSPMTSISLARIIGLPLKQTIGVMERLVESGVASRDQESGALLNRRMVRDEGLRQVRTEAGRLGGNPNLVKQKSTKEVKDDANQIITPSSSSSTSSTEQKNPPVVPPKPTKDEFGKFRNVLLTQDEFNTLWNKFPDARERIEALSEYIESKGKKYKSHYATILTWERKNGAQNHGNNKQDRNAEAARRLLSRLNSQDSGGSLRGDPGVESSRLSRTLAAIDGRADENRD